MKNLKRLIFDADDTLWENNRFYEDTTLSVIDFIAKSGFNRDYVQDKFNEIELNFVKKHGYGTQTFLNILEKTFQYPKEGGAGSP